MDSIDADLLSIRKLQNGEVSGLEELMSRHRESLFQFVYRYVGNETDAAELTEETFFRVYQKADRFRPKAKVSTWIFAIAGNLCRDFLRKNKKRSGDCSLDAQMSADSDATGMGTLASEADDPSEATVSNEAVCTIQQAVAELPHKLKFPFVFCVLEDHSYDACAAILKTSRKTVETRIYRARKLLQGALAHLEKLV